MTSTTVSESSSIVLPENPTPGNRLGVADENSWKSRQILVEIMKNFKKKLGNLEHPGLK